VIAVSRTSSATPPPPEGKWSENDYLRLETNHLVELCDGQVEVLPMPTTSHQRIVAFLLWAFVAFASPRGLGETLFAPLRVRLRDGCYREPDIVFMLKENAARVGEKYWDGADLVVEVVSEDDPDRDWMTKRIEYAEAGIPEYWIVDPRTRRVTVLTLQDGTYVVHAEAGPGHAPNAASDLLKGFQVDAAEIFNAGRS
jgi:Uma2 family endonuclease